MTKWINGSLFLPLGICCVLITTAYAVPPEDIATIESVSTQTVSGDEIASPYIITGESLVNLVRSMVDFDIEGARIVFNRKTGQLFVKNTPSNQIQIEEIINKMRTATLRQVEIEARLVAVSVSNSEGFGMDTGDLNFYGTAGKKKIGTKFPLDSNGDNYSEDESTFVDFPSFVNALNDSTYGGQFSFVGLGDQLDIDFFIDVLKSKTQVNTLAAPKLTVFNNQRAHIKIEKRENFISEIQASFDTVGHGVTSVWYQLDAIIRQAQSGTILDVTPSINPDGTISIELHPTYVTADLLSNQRNIVNVTNSEQFTNPLVLPIFTAQSIDTSLTLPNGGVAALGGLITESETKGYRKVPFFGDIPLVGKIFFTQERTVEDKAYLLMFIKAKVKKV